MHIKSRSVWAEVKELKPGDAVCIDPPREKPRTTMID
jgi:hypothetical protein